MQDGQKLKYVVFACKSKLTKSDKQGWGLVCILPSTQVLILESQPSTGGSQEDNNLLSCVQGSWILCAQWDSY